MAESGNRADLVAVARLLWQLLRAPSISPVKKIVVPLVVIAYVLSPIDLVPDAIPWGTVDDLGAVMIGVMVLLSIIIKLHQEQSH